MGKASTAAATTPTPTTEMKRKKKKGRPSLTDLQKRQRLQQQQQQPNQNQNFPNKNSLTPSSSSPVNYDFTPARRSTRRNPNLPPNSPPPFDEDDDDDDDERKEKKVKLVVRLPQSNHLSQPHQVQNSQHSDSGSGSGSEDSDADLDLGGDDQRVASPKKRKINAVDRRSDDAVSLQEEKVSKATDNRYGSQLESGPTTTLPDKKLLLFILDRLQKKDTYGVFSEPVDPNELPDYHEIIEHPMDFGTVRKKLGGGVYSNLEELEADVLLICSNAMQYNAPDTVYFRQARAIQELAKRDFANLRHEGDDGEPQPKLVRRGRPPSKNLKKPLESSPVERIGSDLSSGATLASGEDKAVGSNSYSLRKGPPSYRVRSTDAFVTPHRSRNGESDWSIDWSSEFPAHILRADMKYGKKNFIVDENKRDTYKEYHPPAFDNDLSMFSNIDGDMKRLMAVGLHFDRHAYARSLAKFAADLGPVAWKIASRKIDAILPPGVKFGPGWVGENEAPSELSSFSAEKLKSPRNVSELPPFSTEKLKSPSNVASDCHSSRPATPSLPGINNSVQSRPSEEMVEAVRRLNCQGELAVHGTASPWGMQGSSFQAQLKSAVHPNRNGFNGMVGYNLSQLGMARPALPSGQSGVAQGSMPPQMLAMVSRNDASSIHPMSSNQHPDLKEPKSLQGWGASHSANLSVRGKVSESSTESGVGLSGKLSQQELAAQQRQPLPIPPDLNIRIQAPGSPSSSLRIGSPQQPDLALQL